MGPSPGQTVCCALPCQAPVGFRPSLWRVNIEVEFAPSFTFHPALIIEVPLVESDSAYRSFTWRLDRGKSERGIRKL